MAVWAPDFWATGVWEVGVWDEGTPDITGIGTHTNAAQIHLVDAAFAVRGVGTHVNAAQAHMGAGSFFEGGLPAEVVAQVIQLVLAGLVLGNQGRVSDLDGSQTLLILFINELQVGASLAQVDEFIDLIRTHFLGGIAEFGFNSANVTRVTDADSHQIKVWMQVVNLLKPFSSDP